MGFFGRSRRQKPKKKSAQAEQKDRPRGQKNPFEKAEQEKAKTGAKEQSRALLWWRGLPWWRRFLLVLAGVGIGLGIWFGAQWYLAPPPSYSVNAEVDPGGSGSISLHQLDYSEGTQVTLTATPSQGYEFVSWSGDASGVNPTVKLTMDSDKRVVANFRIIEYSLATQVSPAGAGRVSPNIGNYASGSSITLMAMPTAGYEFDFWSGDISERSPVVKLEMYADKTVIANFRVVEYTLTTSVSSAEGGQVSPASGHYDNGSLVTLTATPSPGYEFVFWSGDASGVSPSTTLVMDSDKSVVAEFDSIRQRITYTMETGISGSVVTYASELERGDIVEGFVELTGVWYSYDRTFRWTFEIFGPEGRKVYYWYRGHWVERNHRDFSFTAPLDGSYKIKITHNSLHRKFLVIEIQPKGWTLKSP